MWHDLVRRQRTAPPTLTTTTSATTTTVAPSNSAVAAVVDGSVGVWLAAIALLQDEDDEVRDAARRAVCAASLALRGETSHNSSIVDTRAIAIAYDTMTRFFWWAQEYSEYAGC